MKRTTTLLAGAIAAMLSQNAHTAPSQEQMWEMLQELKQQNEALQKEVRQLKNAQYETNEKLDATATAIEDTSSRVERTVGWYERTKVSGYGELHYNNLHDSRGISGNGGGFNDDNDFEEIDLHRVILSVSHQFTDKIRLFIEVEFEHIDELVVEQTILDFDVHENATIRAGAFLVPIGIINETHEPPTFYGVERNIVETDILPATWTEGGVGVFGKFGGGTFSYNLYVHSGLAVDDDFNIRNGRQKVSDAIARDFATTGRIKYLGIRGLELALAVQYQEDVTQGRDNANALLWETHLIYNTGPFTLKALYAAWDIDGSAARTAEGDDQYGWYIEPSWKITPRFGIFMRYSDLELAENNVLSDIQQFDFGFNYYPHENVVIKADYQMQQTENTDPNLGELSGFNLGIGYQFF